MKQIVTPVLAAAVALLGLTSTAFSTRAQDIRGYDIERHEYFTQCTTNRADLVFGRRHYIFANVVGGYEGALTSATLSAGQENWFLTNVGADLHLSQRLPAPAGGSHQLVVTTAGGGVKSRTFTLPTFARSVPPARIANFNETQAIDASQPFGVRWDPVRRLGGNDKLRLSVYDSNGVTLLDVQLGKADTGYTIPAGTLRPNEAFAAYLRVVHYLSIVRATATRPYFVTLDSRRTQFMMKTRNAAGTFEFASNKVLARETDGAISIDVDRTGGNEGTVTTDYYVEGVTAQAGVNYASASGTLIFAPGATRQTIAVPLLNDGVATGPLIARVWLTNATGGASLPRRRSLDWTILDATTSPGPSVNALVVSKVYFYSQTDAAAPERNSLCVISRFFASVHPKFPGAISNAVVRLPNGTARELATPVRTFLEHNENFPSRLSLDRAFKPGRYFITTDTLADGRVSAEFRLRHEPAFPVPHLTSWTESQNIEASTPFALKWEPFASATSNDFVLVSIRALDNHFLVQTPETFEPGALSGTTDEFTIPGDTLATGQRYLVDIIFAKTASRETVPGLNFPTCVVFDHTTSFYIHTAPASAATLLSTKSKSLGVSSCCGLDEIPVEPNNLPDFDFK